MTPPGAERSEREKPCWYVFFSTPRKRDTGLAKEVGYTYQDSSVATCHCQHSAPW